MFDEAHLLEADDGAMIRLRHSRPSALERGVLLVHHGLAEHSLRYARFAEEMAALGFHVFAHDHRGHGETRGREAPPRRFAARDGALRVLEDARLVHERAMAEAPGLPVVLLGHSMGGLIALNHARRHGGELAGLCVWNADVEGGRQVRLGRLALKVERALKGSDVASALFARATFETWARSVPQRRTPADWLSHDRYEIEAYLADPLCGWTPTVSMAEDILALILKGSAGLCDLPPALPVHLLGGGADPATDGGTGVARLGERLRRAGSRDVTTRVVPGARHETLNETDTYRDPALRSLTLWLERIAPRTSLKPQAPAEA